MLIVNESRWLKAGKVQPKELKFEATSLQEGTSTAVEDNSFVESVRVEVEMWDTVEAEVSTYAEN